MVDPRVSETCEITGRPDDGIRDLSQFHPVPMNLTIRRCFELGTGDTQIERELAISGETAVRPETGVK